MNAYTGFAQVYDAFMDNVPYEEGCRYLCGLLAEYGIRDGLLAELGCGTGSLTERMSAAGYDMIGIDSSIEMLELANEKRLASGHDILYLLQDMRAFELYGTVRGIISFCDSLNYIADPNDLLTVFRLANTYLDPGGCFIFDFHTRFYYETELGERTIAEDREHMSFIWDNYYDPERHTNDYLLSIFVEESPKLYRKFQEEHVQYAYTLEEMKRLLTDAGLEYIAAYDAFSRRPPRPDSSRIHIVAREHGKEA